jgi:hypothetical protein
MHRSAGQFNRISRSQETLCCLDRLVESATVAVRTNVLTSAWRLRQ